MFPTTESDILLNDGRTMEKFATCQKIIFLSIWCHLTELLGANLNLLEMPVVRYFYVSNELSFLRATSVQLFYFEVYRALS